METRETHELADIFKRISMDFSEDCNDIQAEIWTDHAERVRDTVNLIDHITQREDEGISHIPLTA